MWTCPCSSQNEEEALACVSCGRERVIQESAQEAPPPTFMEIEEARRELEETIRRKEKEAVPTPTPTPARKEAEEMEELRLDVEEPKQSIYDEIEDLGKELGEVPLTTPKETEERAYEEILYEEEKEGSTAKKVLRIIDITLVCIIIVIVAIFAVVQIGGIGETGLRAYLSRCLGIWIRSIIITQAVLIIGGIIYFLLREPKVTKAR
ncbi:MAG: zinc finger Ran-binding domain-containing protein [Candidatus Brocadiales bacterium]